MLKLRVWEAVAPLNTRQEKRIQFLSVTLEFGNRSFPLFGPQLVNDLPGDLREVF